MITLSKSQVETIALEAIQVGATAIAQQLDAKNVAKEVSILMQVDGESLVQAVTSSTMKRYSQNLASDVRYEDVLYEKVLDQYQKEGVLVDCGKEGLLLGCESVRQKVEAILTNLACRDFSFAAHVVTGWGVVEYGVESDVSCPWYHTVCKIPGSDLFLDAKGVRTEAEILAEYPSPVGNESRYAVDIDPESSYICESNSLELLAAFLIGKG